MRLKVPGINIYICGYIHTQNRLVWLVCFENLNIYDVFKYWMLRNTILAYTHEINLHRHYHTADTDFSFEISFTSICWNFMWTYNEKTITTQCLKNWYKHTHRPCLSHTPSMSISANVMRSRSMGTSARRFRTSIGFISDTGVMTRRKLGPPGNATIR